MAVARLRIGNYTFALSPKGSLDFTLSRNVYKLETVGDPTYQDMGIDEKKLTFSGSIVTSDAWHQAETIESLMDTGLPQTLLYGTIQRTVRIASFSPKYLRQDRVDYEIELIVIPPKSGYNAPQQMTEQADTILPIKSPPAATSTASIAQYADSTYTVKQGDTLWGIATRNLPSGSTASDIATFINTVAKANQLNSHDAISVGQVLKMPTGSNIQNANTAYATRQAAIVTTAGVNFVQTMEGSVRFDPGGATLSG